MKGIMVKYKNIINIILIFIFLAIAGCVGVKIESKKLLIPATEIESLSENNEIIGEKGYISSAVITQRKTGTGPFDSNDEAGNDSSEDNNIVRSFDQVTWTIENNIKLKNEQSGESYKGGKIQIKAEIPEIDANYVEWDIDSMKWAENPELSNNGTTFTAEYSMSTSEITLPGKQSLVFILKVLGAPNGIEIKPQFTIKLEGNDESEQFILNDSPVKVSAAPNYNIKLSRNTNLAQKTTVDYGQGETRGRMYGYTFVLQLYNTDENKGLKGIEYPKDNIDFNINLKLTRTKFNSTEIEDITNECTPILWNYKLNENTNNEGLIEGRTMMLNNRYSIYNQHEPYGIQTPDRSQSVYNSGNLSMVQEGSIIHTKVSNYGFDGQFPQYNIYKAPTSNIAYKNNIGCFNVSYFQVFVPDNEASTIEERNYYLEISDSNLKMTSTSGIVQENQQVNTDDNIRLQHIIYQKGIYSHNLSLAKDKEWVYLGQGYETGDSKAVLGQYFEIYSRFLMNLNNDDDINSATRFIKFDGNSVEPTVYNNGAKYRKISFDGDMTFNLWYITKKDGTNWSSQHEMNQAKIEDMLYFENIEDIPNGYICVGEYLESEFGNITASSGGNNITSIRLKVKESAEIGKTYGFTQTTTEWIDYVNREEYSIIKNNFSEWPESTWTSGEKEYIKTEYDENGEIITGTHSGGAVWGQSLLIVGADLQIFKDSINEEGEQKINYDLGKNENSVIYKLTPQIVNSSLTDAEIENINLKVEDTLPKGINYIPGSSNYGEPTIVENDDDTMTLRWNIYNCKLSEAINPIIYKAHINEETQNGTQYTSNAVVSEIIADGETYKVGNSEIKNRTATNTIQIINLESYSLFKITNTPVREVNEEFHYKITALNKTDSPVTNFQMLDILPYNGDNRGTHYNGNYIIYRIELSQKDISTNENLDIQNLKIVTTNDETVRTSITAKDSDLGQGSIWTEVNSGDILNREIKGVAILGELSNKGKLELDIYLKPDSNVSLDEYKNSATAQTNTETEVISTPIIEVKVIKRSIEGKVWFDINKNGLMDENEPFLEGEEISLISEDGTVAKNTDNEEIQPVETDENGYYKFENMKKGNYRVKIKYKNSESNKEITLKSVGINTEINSKFNSDGVTDLITTLNNNDSPKEEVKHINAGITYKQARVIVHHYIEGTTTPVRLKDGTNAEEQIITGKVNDNYNTSIADVPEYYELTKMPSNAQGKMQLNDIEVIYYYRLKKYPYIVKYVDKETGQDILKPKENEEVEYGTNIRAEDEIINIEKYTYDSADKEVLTINTENNQIILYYIKKTGTVTAKYIDINTNLEIEQEEELSGKVDSNYTTTKKNIIGYTFVEDTKNTTGKFTETPINVTYYYKKNTKVTVNHIDKITGEILYTITENGLVGDEYTSTSRNFEKYILTEKPSQETVTMTEEEIILNYYYIHISGGVIEKHIDIISGEILDNAEHTGNEGDEYNILPKTFEGYDLVEERLPDNARGRMSKDSKAIEVIYYYKYKSKVISRYIDKNTGLELVDEISQEGYESEHYTTENKIFENYSLVALPENAKGVLTKQTIIVTYYYVHVSAGVVVNHFDIITGEKLKNEERIDGNEGDEYETNKEEFEGYDIVEERFPNNSKGKMEIEEIIVNYYYKHRSKVIIKYIDKITNEEIDTEDIINGYESDEYKTQPKEIDGYEFIGEIPENAEGEMTKETIEIIYYYKRPAKVIVSYIDIDTNQKISEDIIIEGKQNDKYKTEEKEIKKYKLLKEMYPDNSEGSMKITIDTNEQGETIINDTTYVKYYYKKLESNLKVKKEIVNIVVNGEKQNKNSKLEKVEVNRKHILDTTIQVFYRIIVENTGEVEENATLEETIPEGMIMTDDNKEWIKNEGKAIININKIKPQEVREYQIVLNWISNESNMGTLKNQVQLINVENEENIEENNKDDNKDNADIIISIGTGAQKYMILICISIIILIITCVYILKRINK